MLMCVMVLAASVASPPQQQSTTSEERQFEIVSVDGNKVVVKGQRGAQEITVPDGFRFMVDGREVGVSELKPGMKGSAKITTTTTVTPVQVTEVKNGEVLKVAGSSVMVRTANGVKMFTEADAAKRNVKIVKDGKPVALSELREGDTLSATIVTTHPPKVMTERQVQATLSSPPPAVAPAPPSMAASNPPATPTTGTEPKAERRLPRTASQVPLLGLAGVLALAVAFAVRRMRIG